MTEPSSIQAQDLQGLTSLEAERRLAQHGFNELPQPEARGLGDILLGVLAEPMFLLLTVAAGLYLLLGELGEGLLLAGFAGVSVALVVIQEQRSERALAALRDLSSPRALVRRDGRDMRIAGRDLVPGDVVILGEGDRVPADGVLLRGHSLQADESLLTGESAPVRKRPLDPGAAEEMAGHPGGDDRPQVYSGTLVVAGHGLARILATGAVSEIGRIGSSLQSVVPEPTPLQRATRRLVRRLAALGIALSLTLAALIALLRGGWLDGLLAGITLAMATLPEELPMVLMAFLALGAWRLSKLGALARRGAAVESLGAATLLCVDKTGTLTQNRMSIACLQAGDAVLDLTPQTNELPEAFHRLLEFAILASRPRGIDPMEAAMQRLGNAALSRTEHLHPDWRIAQEYELTAGFLAMSQAWAGEGGGYVVAAKGAPETIADLCHLEPAAVERLSAAVQAMALRGLRIIAVAEGRFAGAVLPENQHDFDFALVGLIGLEDPLRPGVPEAIAQCRRAGIRVAMITGDYAATAETIALAAGLASEGGVLTGAELSAMDDAALARRIRNVSVFARIMPAQKLRLVQAFMANGEVVGMTGDGVNDAPALKAAHVGIAMGGRGTDVAREASALVLLNDDFSVIVAAVALGRRIFGNLRKAAAYIMAVHVPIAGLALLPVLLGWPTLLFPAHIAFLEMVIDPVCSIVFEGEPTEPDAMERPPRRREASLFGRWSLAASLLQGFVALVAVLLVYGLAQRFGADEARSLAFTALVAANLCLMLVNRSWRLSLRQSLRRPNPAVWIVLAVTAAVLGLVFGVAPLRSLFHFAPMPAPQLLLAAALGAASALWFEIPKALGLLRRLD